MICIMLFHLVKVHEKCYDCFHFSLRTFLPENYFSTLLRQKVYADPDRTSVKLLKIEFITYNVLTIELTSFKRKIPL